MEKVELLPAFVWDCPQCGRENFVRGLVPELDEDELAEVRDRLGVEPWEEGFPLMAPSEVECSHCKSGWQSIDFGADDDHDELTADP